MSLVILAFVIGAAVQPTITPLTPPEQAALRLLSDPRIDMSPKEEVLRVEVIEILREIAKGDRRRIRGYGFSIFDGQLVLLRLGDDETIQTIIDQYRQNYETSLTAQTSQLIESSAQPKLLPYLAEDFFLDEDVRREVVVMGAFDSIGFPVRSIFSGVLAGRIIAAAKGFTLEMKGWIQDLLQIRYRDRSAYRQTLRNWWRQNGDLVRQGRYGDVKPQPIAGISEEPSPPTPKVEQPRPRPATQEDVARSPDRSQPLAWSLAAMACVAFLFVLLALIRKRRSR